jgi:peptidoglycan/xylan/chitin deacetylase (PgdA/CDA1 family)/GT2 family glycosyltransferase
LEPELSVLIATHDRRELLVRCLDSLAAQEVDPASFEVIVADDGSSDGTAEAVGRLPAPFRLRCLRLEKGGQAAAQNAAIAAAAGRVALILDDDVVAGPRLVAEHLAAQEPERRVLGVGHLEQPPPRRCDYYAAMFSRTWNRHYAELPGRKIDWTACFGANLSAPLEALREVGGFATDIPVGEDMELAYRLEKAGCLPRFLPEAKAVHDDEKGWRRLLEDSRRQGAGQVALADRHPEMNAKLLGWFGAGSRREIALRRLLLALRAPPRLLAPPGRLLPGQGRKEIWFHFVSRLAFWRAVKEAMDVERWERTTRGVPVLMYHAFSERDEGDRYVVSRRALSRQLRLLKLLGYRGIHFDELVEELRAGRLPPRRALAITIDDGYRDNLEVALPLLRKHGFKATIYLVTERLGGVNDWSSGDALKQRPLLSWEQAKEMEGEAIRFGAHTRTHPALPALPSERIAEELKGSREDLEARLGHRVPDFAYPYGELDDEVRAAVAEAGFTAACTVEPRLTGLSEDPLRIPRLEVRAEDSLPRFLFRLRFGMR